MAAWVVRNISEVLAPIISDAPRVGVVVAERIILVGFNMHDFNGNGRILNDKSRVTKLKYYMYHT